MQLDVTHMHRNWHICMNFSSFICCYRCTNVCLFILLCLTFSPSSPAVSFFFQCTTVLQQCNNITDEKHIAASRPSQACHKVIRKGQGHCTWNHVFKVQMQKVIYWRRRITNTRIINTAVFMCLISTTSISVSCSVTVGLAQTNGIP